MREDRGVERTSVDSYALDVRLRGRARGGDDERLGRGREVDGHFVEEGPAKGRKAVTACPGDRVRVREGGRGALTFR